MIIIRKMYPIKTIKLKQLKNLYFYMNENYYYPKLNIKSKIVKIKLMYRN